MATNTYVALDKKTVTSAVSSIQFTSVPNTYTDLVLVVNGTYDTADAVFGIQFNSDTTSLYSDTTLYGSGTASGSYRSTNQNKIQAGWYPYPSSQTVPGQSVIHVMNYANTSMNKTTLERAGLGGGQGVYVRAGLWRSTTAVNSVTVLMSAGNFAVGTTLSLYGIKAWAPEATPKATGGYVYEDSTYWYHAFPFSSTFIPNQSLTADLLVIAGGGGGGGINGGGGGGAGGVLGLTSQSLTATNYTVTVGGGGAASTDGVNSSFASSIAFKGQAGSNSSSFGGGGSGTYGSGSGVGRDQSVARSGGVGTPGQGNNGGGVAATYNGGGGGGGAGAVGNDGGGTNGAVGADENKESPYGNGGVGTNSYASWLAAVGFGVNGYIAGGGGGSGYQVSRNPLGGLGGGGQGSMREIGSQGATAGVANTGSGGGGGGSTNFKSAGQPGGSGLVIVRYAKA